MSNGDGDDVFVTHSEFRSVSKNLERVNLALWGTEGTTGIIGTLQEMKTKGKMMDRVITVALGIITSLITAVIMRGLV